MKSYTITVNGTVYDVTVEEKLRRQHLHLHRHKLLLRKHRQHPVMLVLLK